MQIPRVVKYYGSQSLWLQLPYRPDTRAWLKCHATRVQWFPQPRMWRVGGAGLPELSGAVLERFGEVEVWSQAKASVTRQCDTRCATAVGPDCRCGCGGLNHSGGVSGYTQIGDTTLIAIDSTTNWVKRYYAK